MRISLLILACLCLFGASAVLAEEASRVKVPPYSVENLVPGEDDKEFKGWEILDDEDPPSGAPTEDALMKLAEAHGIGEDVFYVEPVVFKSDSGQVAAAALVDVEEKFGPFAKALKTQAEQNGWIVHHLGSLMRWLVVGGPDGAKQSLSDALFEHVLYKVADMGWSRLSGAWGGDGAPLKAAGEFVERVIDMEPEAGMAYALRGAMEWVKWQRSNHRNRDLIARDSAAAYWIRTQEQGIRYPPRKGKGVFVAGQLGGILLSQDPKRVKAGALEALQKAVKHEAEADAASHTNDRRYGNRYNLACAYARLGRTSEAFEMLEKALKMGKEILPPYMYRPKYKHAKEQDADMKKLKGDKRFQELMEKYKPPPKPKKKEKKKKDDEEDGGGHGHG